MIYEPPSSPSGFISWTSSPPPKKKTITTAATCRSTRFFHVWRTQLVSRWSSNCPKRRLMFAALRKPFWPNLRSLNIRETLKPPKSPPKKGLTATSQENSAPYLKQRQISSSSSTRGNPLEPCPGGIFTAHFLWNCSEFTLHCGWKNVQRVSLGCTTHPVRITTRVITFLRRNPELNLHLWLASGYWGGRSKVSPTKSQPANRDSDSFRWIDLFFYLHFGMGHQKSPLHPHKLIQPHTTLQLSNTISVSSRAVSYNSFASKGNNFSQAWANLKRTLALDAIAKGNWRSKWCRSCSLLFRCRMFVLSKKKWAAKKFLEAEKSVRFVSFFLVGEVIFKNPFWKGTWAPDTLNELSRIRNKHLPKKNYLKESAKNLWKTFWSLPFSGPFLKRKRGHLNVTFWWDQLEVNEHPMLSPATKNNTIIWLLWLEVVGNQK